MCLCVLLEYAYMNISAYVKFDLVNWIEPNKNLQFHDNSVKI